MYTKNAHKNDSVCHTIPIKYGTKIPV